MCFNGSPQKLYRAAVVPPPALLSYLSSSGRYNRDERARPGGAWFTKA